MDLDTYLKSRNFTREEFAKLVGVHPRTIDNYINMRKEPKLTIAFKIEEVTKGKVTARYLAEKWKKKENP